MPIRLSLFALMVSAAPALAQNVTCEGAIDSSEARLIEIYGAENVETGIVPGPEGTEMLATRVYPDNLKKRLEFVWWNESDLSDPSYIDIPAKMTVFGKVRVGQTIGEIEDLNGEPFQLSGFGWDYGGGANIMSGKLAELPGDCILSLRFSPNDYPEGIDTMPVTGDVQISSDDPLLEQMDVRLYMLAVGYPHPDFRD